MSVSDEVKKAAEVMGTPVTETEMRVVLFPATAEKCGYCDEQVALGLLYHIERDTLRAKGGDE